MRYQNMEIHNVCTLIPCPEGGVRWLRVPENVYEKMEAKEISFPMVDEDEI